MQRRGFPDDNPFFNADDLEQYRALISDYSEDATKPTSEPRLQKTWKIVKKT